MSGKIEGVEIAQFLEHSEMGRRTYCLLMSQAEVRGCSAGYGDPLEAGELTSPHVIEAVV